MGCCECKNGDISKEFKFRFSSQKVSINEEETNVPIISLNSPRELENLFSNQFSFSPKNRDTYFRDLLRECFINTTDRHKSYRCSIDCSCKERSFEDQPDDEP